MAADAGTHSQTPDRTRVGPQNSKRKIVKSQRVRGVKDIKRTELIVLIKQLS